jgi:predicted Co/Zn/Cd cation transporter (cation efflux family)
MKQKAIEKKKKEAWQIRTEHGALMVSMAGAVFFLVAEILMAIYTTSQSILMDAFYGAADMLMILVSLKIVPLIYRPMTEKHPFGFSQAEAVFITLKGTMLTAVTLGLVVTNIQLISRGGNMVSFGLIAVFELLSALIIGAVILILRRINKGLRSPIVKTEIDAWMIDMIASVGLGAAFLLPVAIRTPWMAEYSPYLDQVVAIILAAVILPIPVRTVIGGLRDLFLLAPEEATVEEIKEISQSILEPYGFGDANYDVIRTGRKIWISIYFRTAEDAVFVSRIVQAHRELKEKLEEVHPHLYVELIPEFENIEIANETEADL